MADALPPIDSSLIPASVRNAGPAAQKLYNVALSFEQMLTQQLAQALTASLDTSGGDASSSTDGSSSDASTSMVKQMLPTALAQGLTQSGGLGIANQIYESLGGTTVAAKSASGAAATDPAATTNSAKAGS